MYEKLIGTRVWDSEGRPYQLTEVLGQGSQGMIFAESSGTYVIKVVTASQESQRWELQRRYRWLLGRDLGRDSRLVMPEATLASPLAGYVMRRVRGHRPMTFMLKPPVQHYGTFGNWYNKQTGGLRHRFRIGAMLSRAFASIQSNELAYCDISDTNILVCGDTTKLSLCIIDPDNLSVSDAATSLVLGTPRYIAPEILRGSHQPDALTDNYSLAVLLFQLLRLGHPFLGDVILDGPPEMENAALQGSAPYVDHPENESNRCSSILPAEVVLTTELVDLFARAFVDGINDRGRRPVPEEWEAAMLMAADSTTQCENEDCGAAFFPPQDVNKCCCPWCGHKNSNPPILQFFRVTKDSIEDCIKNISQLNSELVLREAVTLLKARHISFERYGEKGSRLIAALKWERDKNRVLIENRSNRGFKVSGSSGVKEVSPGTKAVLQHNSLILFKENLNRLAFIAKLVMEGDLD